MLSCLSLSNEIVASSPCQPSVAVVVLEPLCPKESSWRSSPNTTTNRILARVVLITLTLESPVSTLPSRPSAMVGTVVLNIICPRSLFRHCSSGTNGVSLSGQKCWRTMCAPSCSVPVWWSSLDTDPFATSSKWRIELFQAKWPLNPYLFQWIRAQPPQCVCLPAVHAWLPLRLLPAAAGPGDPGYRCNEHGHGLHSAQFSQSLRTVPAQVCPLQHVPLHGQQRNDFACAQSGINSTLLVRGEVIFCHLLINLLIIQGSWKWISARVTPRTGSA